MYQVLLTLHSFFRWLVLAGLLYVTLNAYAGWLGKRAFTRTDSVTLRAMAWLAGIQVIMGVWLYLISPVVEYFLHNMKEAVHQRGNRFFGLEHPFMMLVIISLLMLVPRRIRKKATDREKFRTLALWFSAILLIVLASIPWPFSPVSPHRPYFRPF